MAKYRQLYTEFWSDGFVLDLTPEEKYFYLYLMTNSKTSQSGIYELPKRIIETETGYNRDTVDKLLKRFDEYNKIHYCDETKEIMILNWIKYNQPNNINAVKCVNRELNNVKNSKFIKVLYNQCQQLDLDIEKMFKGLTRGLQGDDKEAAGVYEESCNEIIIKNHENEENQGTSQVNEPVIRDLLGAHKGLPSNKIRSNKQEVINKKQKITNKKEEVKDNNPQKELPYDETDDSDFSDVVKVFENNIHPMTPLEYDKLLDWSRDISCNVIIMAIEESVNYNARTMKYIDRILNCWLSKGIKTIKGVKAYQREWNEKKKVSSNSGQGKNSFCDYEQRKYDFKELERKLLGV